MNWKFVGFLLGGMGMLLGFVGVWVKGGAPVIRKHPTDKNYSEHLQIEYRGSDTHTYVAAYPANWLSALCLYPSIFVEWWNSYWNSYGE